MWTGKVYIVFWCGDLRGKDHLEEIGVDGIIILKCIRERLDGGTRTGLVWLRIGKNCGNL
jgi:hypothetical protein